MARGFNDPESEASYLNIISFGNICERMQLRKRKAVASAYLRICLLYSEHFSLVCIYRDLILLCKGRHSINMVKMSVSQHDADRLQLAF